MFGGKGFGGQVRRSVMAFAITGIANLQDPGLMRRNRPFVHAGSAHAYPQCVQINGDDGQCWGCLSSPLATHELSKKRHAEIQISMVSAVDHALRDDT